MKLTIVALTPRGAELARRLRSRLPEATVCLPAALQAADGCSYFADPLPEVLPRLFAESDGLICIMATGIVVRLLARHLRGKDQDPAVVVMDEAGSYAISLLSGHLGGANDLARRLERLIGSKAVITTATDVNGLPSWDAVARRAGLKVEPLRNIKVLNRLLLQGRSILLVDRSGRIARHFVDVPGVSLVPTFVQAMNLEADGRVFVTHRQIPDLDSRRNLLVLRPANLVLGISCPHGTGPDEIEEAVRAVLLDNYLAFSSVAILACGEENVDAQGIHHFARRHALQVTYHSTAVLDTVAAASAPCEPAALLSAGSGKLLVGTQQRGRVSVAVAKRL